MTCKLTFQDFGCPIRMRFARALKDAGESARDIKLELHVDAMRPIKAEFAALTKERIVRVTWNGIATLWACCQGFARLGKAMHEGVQQRKDGLVVEPDSDLDIGLRFLTASMWLQNNDFKADGKAHWIHGVPPPLVDPADEPSKLGNSLFYGALAWVLRHEIAHITLGHIFSVPDKLIPQEVEADEQAAKWLRGDRAADQTRAPGDKPTGIEIELEQRAMAVVLGTLWVATYEIRARQASLVHPPISDRIYNTLDIMQLREDSAALLMAGNCIEVFIDPERKCSEEFENSLDFLRDAARRLQHFMLDHKESPHTPIEMKAPNSIA